MLSVNSIPAEKTQSPSNKENNEKSETFIKRNIVPISLGTAVGSSILLQFIDSKKLLQTIGLSKKKHGISWGKFGAIAAAASFFNPFGCISCSTGMLAGAAGVLAGYLPNMWKGTTHKGCNHKH